MTQSLKVKEDDQFEASKLLNTLSLANTNCIGLESSVEYTDFVGFDGLGISFIM
jgi:uncharacterized lipoprotein YehR (DUF1307 family)